MALAPNRLDWRWAQVVDACDYTDAQAVHRLRKADDVTQQLYRFKRALDAGDDVSSWPEMAAAYEIFINRENDRLYMEGALLTDASMDTIAADLACDVTDVDAFHDVFFDVKPRLTSPAWVVSNLFQGSLYAGLSVKDRVGQLRRVAWLGGFDIFRSYYTGNKDPSLRGKIGECIRDMLAKQSFLVAGCINGGAEINMQMLSVYLDDTQKQLANAVGGGSDEMGDILMKFITSFPMEVADPSNPANLNLPAREPRGHELRAEVKNAPAPLHV